MLFSQDENCFEVAKKNMRKIPFLRVSAFFIAFITFLIYLPALQNGFVNFDDNILVYENPNIGSIDSNFLKWAITAETGLWIPLTLFSLATDHAIWGFDPIGYHLTNIIFHAVNSSLVFILVGSLLSHSNYTENKPDKKAIIAGIVTSVLFGIHPLHVESVTWVTERKDVLYAFFFLLSLMAYLRYSYTNLKRHYILSIIFFILSLMSKPMAVSLPLVLLILDFYPLRRLTIESGFESIRWVLVEKLPFLFVSLLLSLTTAWVHPLREGWETLGIYPLMERIFTAVHTMIFYLFKIFLPFNLAPIYPSNLGYSIFESTGFLVVFIITTIFSFRSLKKNKLFPTIWLYYIVTLIPVLGIIAKPGDQLVADRYTYLPSLGPFFLIGLGIAAVFEKCSKKAVRVSIIVALFLALSTLGIRTVKQIAIWSDSITLWSHEIKLYPGKVLAAHNNRGKAYGTLGNYNEAIKDYNKVIELNPLYADVYHARGNIYFKLGNYQQAVGDYTFAIQLKTKYYKEAYSNRGIANYSIGDYQQAINDFNNAIMLDPQDKTAYDNREIVYQRIGHK